LARAAAASFDDHLAGLVQDGHSIVNEGEQVLGGISFQERGEAIMDDETGHKKRTSPVGGRPDDADADNYDRTRAPVGYTGNSVIDEDL
jgi:hypothetical protein